MKGTVIQSVPPKYKQVVVSTCEMCTSINDGRNFGEILEKRKKQENQKLRWSR
jgi:hypothetical protein